MPLKMKRPTNITTWYGISFGAALTLILIYRSLLHLLKLIKQPMLFQFRKHLAYPHFFGRRHMLIGRPTRSNIVCGVTLLTPNIICMTVFTKSKTQIGQRAAHLSTFNLILIVAGPLSMISQQFGISLRMLRQLHSWIGIISASQAIFHAAVLLASHQRIVLNGTLISGIVGVSAMALLFITSAYSVRLYFYEFFFQSHVVLTIVILGSVLWHTIRYEPAWLYVVIGASLWLFTTVTQWTLCGFTNKAWGRAKTKIEIQHKGGILYTTVYMPRQIRIKAGQYIYLGVPRASFRSIFQRHPFVISAWENDKNRSTLYLLILPQRGFTSSLLKCTETLTSAIIEGPYGISHNFSRYGTVVMFATGIGITSHLTYLNELVQGYKRHQVKTRRITLIWRVDIDGQQAWIKPLMDKLLQDDKVESILRIFIFVPSTLAVNHPVSKRIMTIFKEPDIAEILENLLSSIKGETVISVSCTSPMREEIRDFVSKRFGKETRLVELDFQPSTSMSQPKQLDYSCIGVDQPVLPSR